MGSCLLKMRKRQENGGIKQSFCYTSIDVMLQRCYRVLQETKLPRPSASQVEKVTEFVRIVLNSLLLLLFLKRSPAPPGIPGSPPRGLVAL